MRVSTFVKLMRQPWLLSKDGGLTELARSANAVTSVPARTPDFMKSSSPFIGPFAMRNTVVRHRKGVSPVDIPKSRVEGYSHLDPHLREGDEVVVPTEDPLMQAISISGAVINPVTLAYKPGDRLSILLAAAGGFSEHADRNRVSLVNSAQGPAQPVLLNEDFSIVGDDIALSPGAAVIVESTTISGERPLGVVSVHGEVSNPGSVVITSGVTKVAEVLQKVGGVRSKAALGLSYIIRPETSPGTQIQQRDEDTTRYNFDQRYRMPYVSTNLAKALADTASLDNVPLQSGDIIVVVPTPERVYVYGQVVRPGYVPFTPGKHLSWYVERAGGFATGAQKGRARIIRGMSKVWMEDDDDIVVEPGDEVYVPRPMDVPVNTEIQTYAVIANIAASIALLATTVMALFR
jgi:protein involved in polysaccharide export with SLBB domain